VGSLEALAALRIFPEHSRCCYLGLDALGVVQQGVQFASLNVEQLVQNRRRQLAAVLSNPLLHPLKVVVVLRPLPLEFREVPFLFSLQPLVQALRPLFLPKHESIIRVGQKIWGLD